jgi:cytosine deaminase
VAVGEVTKDLNDKIVFPGFVDCHTHLDKAHTWQRSPNKTKTFDDAIATLFADEKYWTAEDIYKRANFALKSAYAHGSVALRTHFNCPAGVLRENHDIFKQLSQEWADRLTLQYVPLCAEDNYSTPTTEAYFDRAVESGCACIGGMPRMNPDLDKQLDRMLDLAAERGIGLDLHIDENPDPASETLRAVAEAVLRKEFPYPVSCGHCCSISLQSPERQNTTIDLIAHAGLNIISLPLCNLFLMDRHHQKEVATTPKWRGITLIHEMAQRGIKVACSSDNVRDAFYAYGDLDGLEVLVQSLRIAHLDSDLAMAPAVVTRNAADIMQLPDCGRVEAGARAELVCFSARNLSELLSRPWCDRELIHGEIVRTADFPDYRELD